MSAINEDIAGDSIINFDDMSVVIKQSSDILKRFRFTMIAVLIAFTIGAGCAVLFWFGGIEDKERNMLLVVGMFLSGSIVITGAMAGWSTVGTVLTAIRLKDLQKQEEIDQTIEEMDSLMRVLAYIAQRHPDIVDSALKDTEISQDLRAHPAIEERIEAVLKNTE